MYAAVVSELMLLAKSCSDPGFRAPDSVHAVTEYPSGVVLKPSRLLLSLTLLLPDGKGLLLRQTFGNSNKGKANAHAVILKATAGRRACMAVKRTHTDRASARSNVSFRRMNARSFTPYFNISKFEHSQAI